MTTPFAAFGANAGASSPASAEAPSPANAKLSSTADAGTASSTASAASPTSITRLANGLTVLVREDTRFPLVSLRLYVHAGSAYESPDNAGISHVLEHMVFKGTDKRPKGQISTDVEATGGYLNAATSFDYTVYLTDMTSEHWKTGLDVLKDMAFNPTLEPSELESEKDVIVSELQRGEDNPGQRIFRMAIGAALKGTPYERPIIGYEKTIRSFTSDGIRAYISSLYHPQSMLLVVCGNVSAKDVVEEAQKQFGGLANTGLVTPPANQEKDVITKGFTATLEYGPWNKAHLCLALPAPAMGDMRSAQLDVLAQVLGGDASSRFYRTYKYEKRLVDSISVSNYSFERLGLVFIRATLDADKIVPFWENITRDIAALGDTTFSREELDRAKLNIEDDIYRSKETLAGLASKVGYFAFFDKGEQGEENYLNAVRSTDQATLLALVKETLRPEALSLVGLLPEGVSVQAFLSNNAAAQDKSDSAKEASGKEEGREKLESWKGWASRVVADNWSAKASVNADSAKQAATGQLETLDLGKGRTLILIPDTTLPYTAANLVYTGGDTLVDSADQGLGAFTASLLTKGAGELGATALEDYLSDRAAGFGASTGRQTFSINMSAPSRFNADMFSLLKTVIESPAMQEEEADRVRQNQAAAITAREDQPTGLAFRRMFPFLFGRHPY
ncbi:insulinase family protein, partial [Desulfovibrio sp. OttesenSCG-928-G15]|nr:insulinase family protein [Desulfovibrio sp. OttesenSCG-928-G15]